ATSIIATMAVMTTAVRRPRARVITWGSLIVGEHSPQNGVSVGSSDCDSPPHVRTALLRRPLRNNRTLNTSAWSYHSNVLSRHESNSESGTVIPLGGLSRVRNSPRLIRTSWTSPLSSSTETRLIDNPRTQDCANSPCNFLKADAINR